MSGIPAVSASQMAEIDRIMASRYSVQPIQLMEHAGRAVAERTRHMLANSSGQDVTVAILAGTGGNGGDALVAARFLPAWKIECLIVPSKPASGHHGLAAPHLDTAHRLGIPMSEHSPDDQPAIVIDGLLGSGVTAAPRGRIAELIVWANASTAPVLAIDVPSGLNATTGEGYDPCIVATETLTLALPKTGLLQPQASSCIGSLFVADIGIPALAYEHIGAKVQATLFASAAVIQLTGANPRGHHGH